MAKLIDKIGKFTTIPNALIKLWPVIGGDAVMMFMYLRYRSDEHDQCFPSLTLMQQETDLSRKRIVAALKTLEDHGLLLKERRFSGSTIYTLLMPQTPTLPVDTAESGDGRSSGNGKPVDNSANSVDKPVDKPVDNSPDDPSSSAAGTLMDAPISAAGALPLVPQVHHISAAGAPPLVQQVHANKTQLTRLTEQDSFNKTHPPKKKQDEEVFSDEFRARLIEAHIFPSTFKRFDPSLTEKDLTALLDWVEETEDVEKVPRFFVARAKDGIKAPKEYYRPACPRCGWHGVHADDCPMRYSVDYR